MAVTEVKFLGAGLTGVVSGKDRLTAKRSYSATFQAKCDSQSDTAYAVIEHFRRTSGLPYIGDGYSFGNDRDASARCKSLTPTLNQNSGGIWNVRAEYEPLDEEEDNQKEDEDGNKQTDPRKWRDEIEVTSTQISVPVEQAIFRGSNKGGRNGQAMRVRALGRNGAVVNSAGVVFDPGIESEVDIKVVRITKNVESYDAFEMGQYQGAVNTDQVIIDKIAYNFKDKWGPQTARIKLVSGVFQIANLVPYWKQTVEVHVSPLGWRRFLVDRGLERRQMPGDVREVRADGTPVEVSPSDNENGEPFQKRIVDVDGYPITTPVLLDGEGSPLQPDQNAVYLEYQVYFERPFAGFRW
jgi:hypothetical protein